MFRTISPKIQQTSTERVAGAPPETHSHVTLVEVDIVHQLNQLLEGLASLTSGPRLREKKVQDLLLAWVNWVHENYTKLAEDAPEKTLEFMIELLKKAKISTTKWIVTNILQNLFESDALTTSALSLRHIPLFIDMLRTKDLPLLCEALILLTKFSAIKALDEVLTDKILPLVTTDFFADLVEHPKEGIAVPALVIFSNLSSFKINRGPIGQSRAFISLLKLLSSPNETILLRAVITCSHMSVETDSHLVMLKASALQKLMALLNSTNPEIALRAIVTLSNLANTQAIQKNFRNKTHLEALLGKLKSSITGINSHLIRTLALLSQDDIIAKLIHELGGLRIITLELRKRNHENSKHLLSILNHLSIKLADLPLFIDTGIIPFLITLLKIPAFEHKESILTTLSNLLFNKSCRSVVVLCDVIPLLFQTLEDSSLEIRRYGALSIARLTEDLETLPLMQDPKKIDQLLKLLHDEDQMICTVTTAAIAQLAASEEITLMIGRQGGIAMLMTLVSSTNTTISHQGLLSLAALMSHEENRKELININGLPYLMDLLKSDDTTSVHFALQVLVPIASDDKNSAILLKHGAIERLDLITRSKDEEDCTDARAILAKLWVLQNQLAEPPQQPVKPPKDLPRKHAPSIHHLPFFTPPPSATSWTYTPRLTPREKGFTSEVEQLTLALSDKHQAISRLHDETERTRATIETLQMRIEEHQARASSKYSIVVSERDALISGRDRILTELDEAKKHVSASGHSLGDISDEAAILWAARVCASISTNEECRDMLTRLGFIPFLAKQLQHEANDQTLAACLYALINLTNNEISLELLLKTCDIDRLISLCSHPLLIVKNGAAGLLARAAFYPTYQDILMEKGALTPIIELVRLEVMDKRVNGQLIFAVWALSFFAYFEPSRTWIEKADGIDLLTSLVNHPHANLRLYAENALLPLFPSFISLLKTNSTKASYHHALEKMLQRLHLDESSRELLTVDWTQILSEVAKIKELPHQLCSLATQLMELSMQRESTSLAFS
ncbi:MAG: hypothetical protein NTW94_03020 [Legionellales bacterium]|nr:hypothetical protein [Legionellales bacterium]